MIFFTLCIYMYACMGRTKGRMHDMDKDGMSAYKSTVRKRCEEEKKQEYKFTSRNFFSFPLPSHPSNFYKRNSAFSCLTLALAASSTNHHTRPGKAGLTREAGNPSSGLSNTVLSTSTFPGPVATNATLAAWLSTAYVSVILLGGGLGEFWT